MAVAFPLGSASTSPRESVAEVVADDVARLIARVLVMADVLARAEVRYTAHDNHRPLLTHTSTLLSRKVKASHTRYRALGPELIPVYRQSACR